MANPDVGSTLGHVTRMPRRTALGLLGATGVALAGCKVQTGPTDAGASAPPIEIPDSGAKLPTDKVSFRWLDGGGNIMAFNKPLFAAYQAKHPNITVQYDGTNMDTLNETVPLGVRNGTAPDVFAIGNKIQHLQAIQEGWCQPLDDLIPDFDTWRKGFPDGAFVANEHVVAGKTYSFPITGSGSLTEMLIYNPELLDKAGVDPDNDLQTWDQFRAAAKKIATAGKGQFYGLMDSRTPIKIIEGLLSTAGWYGGLDLHTGEYAYTAPVVSEVIDLMLAIQADGSLWPDFASISAADARGRMPNNVAGLQIDGPYSINDWEQVGWQFGFRLMPTKEAGATYTDMYSFSAGSNVFVFAKAKQPEIAGDLFSYIGSLAGQTELVLQSRGSLLPSIPAAQDKAKAAGATIDPNFAKVNELSGKIMRSVPVPSVRNPDVTKVQPAPVTPSFSDLVGGMLTGQVKDIKAECAKLNDKMSKALDDAIAKAVKGGAKVSREDYVFSNWDPSKDYTQADYDKS